MTQPGGEVKRYQPDWKEGHMWESSYGAYILHSDHVAEMERVRRETVENVAWLVQGMDKSTHPADVAYAIRGMAGEGKIEP